MLDDLNTFEPLQFSVEDLVKVRVPSSILDWLNEKLSVRYEFHLTCSFYLGKTNIYPLPNVYVYIAFQVREIATALYKYTSIIEQIKSDSANTEIYTDLKKGNFKAVLPLLNAGTGSYTVQDMQLFCKYLFNEDDYRKAKKPWKEEANGKLSWRQDALNSAIQKYVNFADNASSTFGDLVKDLLEAGLYAEFCDRYQKALSLSSRAEQNAVTEDKSSFTPRQKIVYGAPGTGKSHHIETTMGNVAQEYQFRTVFHPEYTFSDLFGNLQPKTVYQQSSAFTVGAPKEASLQNPSFGSAKPSIVYSFVPGPLMQAIRSALHHPQKHHVLIIEEINRAHAAAVFGEVFQLLDRRAEGKKAGWSRYPIVISNDAYAYLEVDPTTIEKNTLRIPPNLSIYATMNTSDQGVFPMDTAFKRRWSFKYIPLDGEGTVKPWKEDLWNPVVPLLNNHKWQTVRQAFNQCLLAATDLEIPIPEDKLLGPYFLSQQELKQDALQDAIVEKVLFYLQMDVLKYAPTALFTQNLTINDIRKKADRKELWDAFQASVRSTITAISVKESNNNSDTRP